MLITRMDKILERNNKNKVLRLVAQHLKKHGFTRTKPTIFTRVRGPVIEFIHLHKFTFAAAFCAHLGIRVIHETRAAVGLNGLSSDEIAEAGTNKRKYNFDYYESDESIDICVDRIMEFVTNFAEAWFEEWKEPSILITRSDSPLHENAKITLQAALSASGSVNDAAITRKFFNAP
jgi:hypothetical protein